MTTSTCALALAVAVLVGGPLAASGHAATSGHTPPSSQSFAGYQVVKAKGSVTQASAGFTVPTVTCNRRFSAVGPSVVVRTKADRTGAVTQSGAGVGVSCEQGTPAYHAVEIVAGQETTTYQLSPGDKVVATVTIGAKATTVDLGDLTSGQDKVLTGARAVGGVALIGDNEIDLAAASGAIDPFTKTRFTGADVNRRPIGRQSPLAMRRATGKTVQIAVGKLRRQRAFALTFKRSR